MKFNNRHNPSHSVDGRIIWESRSVGIDTVIIAVVKKHKFVLAGQRGSGAADFQGYWNVPAGYLDWDESGTEASCREVWEETDVDLNYMLSKNKVIRCDMHDPWHVRTDIKANKQNVALRYGAIIRFEKPPLPQLSYKNSEPNEVSSVRWIPIKDIPLFKWCFDHDKVIEAYIKSSNLRWFWLTDILSFVGILPRYRSVILK